MDAAGTKAIEVINATPESVQDAATDFFNAEWDIAMEAFEYLCAKIDQITDWIIDFIGPLL